MPRVSQPATQARRRAENQSRRERVLAAAEAAFLRHGYAGTTTDEIAGQAGISVGTLYNCLGSKESAYAAVVEQVGRDLVAYVSHSVLPIHDLATAIEQLVRFRLAHFDRHRLLLVLFSSDRRSPVPIQPEGVTEQARNLYYGYLDLVSRLFAKGMEQGEFEPMHPLHLALSFEGVLSAFVGYWARPGQQGPLEAEARQIRETFMKMAARKHPVAPADMDERTARPRELFVTSFDMARLRELISVARAFDSQRNAAHLDDLEAELRSCRVVEPSSVPLDVITMNSRVRLKRLPAGEMVTVTLVFPVDAGTDRDNLSVLDPLGTALLGRQVGDPVEAAVSGTVTRYEVAALLYQPEAAGDFHR